MPIFRRKTVENLMRQAVENTMSDMTAQRKATHDAHRASSGKWSGDKSDRWGNLRLDDIDYPVLRENARAIYRKSLIARAIVSRLRDNVINTGLTFESAPLWDLLPAAPQTEDQRQAWKQQLEHLWKLYTESTEADVEGAQTFGELQQTIFDDLMIEGESWIILRYLNSPERISTVAMQRISPEQVVNPAGGSEMQRVKDRGHTVQEGVEFDATGRRVAIHVRDDDVSRKTTRIPFFGPRSGRRFVIHLANYERGRQPRGLPELAPLLYDLKSLTDYDIAELEAVKSQGLWLGEMHASENANPARTNKLQPNLKQSATPQRDRDAGIERIDVGSTALFRNHTPPGYETRWFTPTRPNPNYSAFVESRETTLCGPVGVPLSVLRHSFDASYSAARAEILFFWNNVLRRRAEYASQFLVPYFEAVFGEWVRAGVIQATGFNQSRIQRKALVSGSWNGISRPVVDPVKEIRAIKLRTAEGHTTRAKEAKAYNGSDYNENVERLRVENEQLAEANGPLADEEASEQPSTPTPDTDAEDVASELLRLAGGSSGIR